MSESSPNQLANGDCSRAARTELNWGRGWAVLCLIIIVLAGIRAGLPYYRMWRLIGAIDREGGAVSFRPVGPEWLHRSSADPVTRFVSCFFKQIADVDLSREFTRTSSASTSQLLVALAEHPTLRRLDLSWRPIDEADCRQLGRLKGLERLNLSHTGLTDAALRELRALSQLTALSLAGTLVSDGGLNSLKSFPQLQILALDNTEISDAALKPLQQLSRLQTLTVSQTNLSESALDALLQSMPDLDVTDD